MRVGGAGTRAWGLGHKPRQGGCGPRQLRKRSGGGLQRQVKRENSKRNVSRLKVFRGANDTLLRPATAPIPNTFGVFPG